MATRFIAPHPQPANPTAFRKALAAFNQADRALDRRQTDATRSAYRRSVRRLLDIPAPDVAALAAKLSVVDPFNLDDHVDLVADARRLAGL
jgi:uncharacterized membrane protein